MANTFFTAWIEGSTYNVLQLKGENSCVTLEGKQKKKSVEKFERK